MSKLEDIFSAFLRERKPNRQKNFTERRTNIQKEGQTEILKKQIIHRIAALQKN